VKRSEQEPYLDPWKPDEWVIGLFVVGAIVTLVLRAMS
jgi:hypothetical protein